MSKFLQDIKEDVGYYYVDEHYDLNDFVMLIAFIFLAVGISVAEIIYYTAKDNSAATKMMFMVLSTIFAVPFIAHFLIKIVKMITFKNRKKRCIEKGTIYRGKIVGEIKDKKLFQDDTFQIEKYAFRPIVEYYCNGSIVEETSKYAFSNRFEDVLSNADITVYKYKNDLIIEDVAVADNKQRTIKSINTSYLPWYEKDKQRFDKVILASALTAVAFWVVVFGVKLVGWYLKIFS